jgi:hypothetical protein
VTTDELRRLLAEATPRPWTHRPNQNPYRIVVFGGRKAYEAGYTTSDIEAADAALIAAAVNALPGLLDVVEATRIEARHMACGPDCEARANLRASLARLDGAS